MHRLPTISFERPIPEPDELEASGLSSDDASTLQDRMKLGTAWLCATVIGIVALVCSTISQFSRPATMVGLIGLLIAYAAYGYSLRKKNRMKVTEKNIRKKFPTADATELKTLLTWSRFRMLANSFVI